MRILVNVPLNRKRFALIIRRWLWHAKIKHTSLLLQELMNLGLEYGTRFGISLSIEDFRAVRYTLPLTIARRNLSNYSLPVGLEGYRSMSSRSASNRSARAKRAFGFFRELITRFNSLMAVANPLNLLARTGARGNLAQIRQLSGYRGLAINLRGQVCGAPIAGSMLHGLNIHEHFLCCYGSRKGILDTALKTSEAGYLTRKVVEGTQRLIIKERQCLSPVSLKYPIGSNVDLIGNVKTIDLLILEGKYSTKDIIDPVSQTVLLSASIPLNRKLLLCALSRNLTFVHVYSPLSCEGVICQRCYGLDKSSGKAVSLGQSVGTLAGQAIGEPATQMVLRTFHTGGILESYGSGRRKAFDTANNLSGTFSGLVPYSTLHLMDRTRPTSIFHRDIRHKVHSKHLTCIFNFEQSTLDNFLCSWLPIRNPMATVGSVCDQNNHKFRMKLDTHSLCAFHYTGMCYHLSDQALAREPAWLCSSSPLRSLVRHRGWNQWTNLESVSPIDSGELCFEDLQVAVTYRDKGWGCYIIQPSLGHVNKGCTVSIPVCYGFATHSRLSGFGHTNYLALQRLVSLETCSRNFHEAKTHHNTEQMWFVKRYKSFYINSGFGLLSEKGKVDLINAVHGVMRFMNLENRNFYRSPGNHSHEEGEWILRWLYWEVWWVRFRHPWSSLSEDLLTGRTRLEGRLPYLVKHADGSLHSFLHTRICNMMSAQLKFMVFYTHSVSCPVNRDNYLASPWLWLMPSKLSGTKAKNTYTETTTRAELQRVRHTRPDEPMEYQPTRPPGEGAPRIPPPTYLSMAVIKKELPQYAYRLYHRKDSELKKIICVKTENEQGHYYLYRYKPAGQTRTVRMFRTLLIWKRGNTPLRHLNCISRANVDYNYLCLTLHHMGIITWRPHRANQINYSSLRIKRLPKLRYAGLVNGYGIDRDTGAGALDSLNNNPYLLSRDSSLFNDLYYFDGVTILTVRQRIWPLPRRPWLYGPSTASQHKIGLKYRSSLTRDLVFMAPSTWRKQLRSEWGFINGEVRSSYSSAFKNVVLGFNQKLTRINFDPQGLQPELSSSSHGLLQDAYSVIRILPHYSAMSGRLSQLKCHPTGATQNISSVFDYHYKPFLNLNSSTSISQRGFRKAKGFLINRASDLHRWTGENVNSFSSLSQQSGTQISRGPIFRGRLHEIILDWRQQKTTALANKMAYPKWLPWTPSLQLVHYPNLSLGGSSRDIIVGVQLLDAILENRRPLAKAAVASGSGVTRAFNRSKRALKKVRNSLYYFQSFTTPSLNTSIRNSTHLHICYGGQPVETGLAWISASISKICEAQFSFQGVFTANKLSLCFGQQILSRSLFRQYFYQGVKLPSVHFEVVASRMASCVRVVALGQVCCNLGDIMPLGLIHMLNQAAIKYGYHSCSYRPVIIGVSKSVLLHTGLLSSASFQEPLKILTDLSIQPNLDWCVDLKARIITGDIISAGTGMRSSTKISARRDGWKWSRKLKYVFSSFRRFNKK